MSKRKPEAKVPAREISGIYQRIREILESARAGVARTVNTTQVVANWLIGREIVEEEQKGQQQRAAYGERLLLGLADRLRRDFGPGYSLPQLKNVRAFYLGYPHLLDAEKGYATPSFLVLDEKGHAVRSLSAAGSVQIPHAPGGELHKPESVKVWELKQLRLS